MAWLRDRAGAGLVAALLAAGPSSALAVDLQLLADPVRACAWLATAPADDVARLEIWLTILQRDAAADGRLSLARGDRQRLAGEARVIEAAISVIEDQIARGHASLRALRRQLRTVDNVPELQTVQTEMRATAEELIEISFDLRDAKAHLAAMRAAMAGRRDSSAIIDAAETAARLSGSAIRACAVARRAQLATCDTPLP